MATIASNPPTPTTMPDPSNLTWPEFDAMSPREKGQYLAPGGRLQALLYSQQFDRELLDHLFRLAELVRDADETLLNYIKTLLATKSGALYFTQPSTRTFTSFSLAARATGMMCEEIRDAEMSSVYKGESEIDTLLTLAELSDAIIMRQGDHSLIDRFAFEVVHRGYSTRILNGGSGSEQHPTQALLELYTLVSHFDLANVEGGSFSELQMGDDLTDYLDENGTRWRRTDDMDGQLPTLDAIYMMRMQDEYGHTSEETRSRYDDFRLTTNRAAAMKPDACILHPLPRRSELPIELDADPRAMYWEAVNRGKFVRIALLLHMFGKDDIQRIGDRAY
ncbi:MAG: aspartate carbamoyltransferase [Planctomycetota bacterium]|jgi:aspartate carbamoyltransferase catalytic subunit